MTIDEAIARERQQAKEQRNHIGTWDDEYSKKCEVYAEEHEQLAEWLEELKDYQDKNKMVVRVDVENMNSIKDKIEELSKYAGNQYNKAIDDFVKEIKEEIKVDKNGFNSYYGVQCIDVLEVLEIARRLKGRLKDE